MAQYGKAAGKSVKERDGEAEERDFKTREGRARRDCKEPKAGYCDRTIRSAREGRESSLEKVAEGSQLWRLEVAMRRRIPKNQSDPRRRTQPELIRMTLKKRT